MSTRRCRGCGRLLHARDACTPCDTSIVHVITSLGADPTLPGRRSPATLGPITRRGSEYVNGIPVWRYDPWAGVPEDVVARATEAYGERIDQMVADTLRRQQ